MSLASCYAKCGTSHQAKPGLSASTTSPTHGIDAGSAFRKSRDFKPTVEMAMTTDPKPVTFTEEQLQIWWDFAHALGEPSGDQYRIAALIAAVREARAEVISSRQTAMIYQRAADRAEAKLAEIRAVVSKGLKYDWTNAEAGLLRYHQYVERLEEVIGE